VLFFTDTDIGKKYHIGGRYIGWTDNRYASIIYIYQKELDGELDGDGRRWFVAMNTGTSTMHNHALSSEWKINPRVLADISNAVSQNLQS